MDLTKYHGRVCRGFMWLKVENNGGLYEHGNETSGSIKFWQFDWFSIW
jgi:hypothetical protein